MIGRLVAEHTPSPVARRREVSRERGWPREWGPIVDLEAAGVDEWRRWHEGWLTTRRFDDGSVGFFIVCGFAHPRMMRALAELIACGWTVTVYAAERHVAVEIRETT